MAEVSLIDGFVHWSYVFLALTHRLVKLSLGVCLWSLNLTDKSTVVQVILRVSSHYNLNLC